MNIALRMVVCLLLSVFAVTAADKKKNPTWTDPAKAAAEDPDFKVQGEYAGFSHGVQVVALGGGKFQANFGVGVVSQPSQLIGIN